ncbi:unnamed protein product [Parnassius apollo]|uniref:(apollo) hypothetical protein n=1 Tax=Parnassius apollo TaxID=110799 RepID=A0A8S3XHI5_PARAO|nr:unnamed protein product [Parnassius apollo]
MNEMRPGQALETSLHVKRQRMWQPLDQGPDSGVGPSTSVSSPAPVGAADVPLADSGVGPSTSVSSAAPVGASDVPLAGSVLASAMLDQGPDYGVGQSSSVSSAAPISAADVPLADSVLASAMVDQGPHPRAGLSWALTPAGSMPSPVMLVECGGPGFMTPSDSGSAIRRPLPRPRRLLDNSQIEFAVNCGSEPSTYESDEEEELARLFLPRTVISLMDTPIDIEPDDEATSSAHSTTTKNDRSENVYRKNINQSIEKQESRD